MEGAQPSERPTTYAVCPEHEPRLRAYHTRLQRRRTVFYGAMIVVLFSAPLPAFTDAPIALAVPLGLLGAALVALPFATPTTVRLLGIVRSILMVRLVGGVLLGAAAVFLLLALA